MCETGESFVVIGVGLIGQIALQLLRANGCRVIALDKNEERLQLCRQMGAETCKVDDEAAEGALGRRRAELHEQVGRLDPPAALDVGDRAAALDVLQLHAAEDQRLGAVDRDVRRLLRILLLLQNHLNVRERELHLLPHQFAEAVL